MDLGQVEGNKSAGSGGEGKVSEEEEEGDTSSQAEQHDGTRGRAVFVGAAGRPGPPRVPSALTHAGAVHKAAAQAHAAAMAHWALRPKLAGACRALLAKVAHGAHAAGVTLPAHLAAAGPAASVRAVAVAHAHAVARHAVEAIAGLAGGAIVAKLALGAVRATQVVVAAKAGRRRVVAGVTSAVTWWLPRR